MNVLIIRTSALGDIVHSLPVLTALRRHRPDARIGWVVEEVFAPLLNGHADLDAVLPVRLKSWRRWPTSPATWRDAGRAMAAVRGFRADVALDLMGNHKGGLLGALSGAGRRIGLDRASRREPSSVLWDTATVAPRGVHAVDRALALLDRLGLPREAADFGGPRLGAGANPEGGQTADPDEPFCLLHPGAGWGNKVYPPERWGAIARGLLDATGIPTRIALSPSPVERALAERIEAAADGAARPVDAGDLPSLVELSRRARLVLGGDTGPVHLAHALDTPVLCLMGPTDPERHGPYGHPERALAHRLPCSYCYRRLGETKACLLMIRPVDAVERAAKMLLDSATENPGD